MHWRKPRLSLEPGGSAEPRSGLELRGRQKVGINVKQFDSCLAETRDTGLRYRCCRGVEAKGYGLVENWVEQEQWAA